MAYVRGHRRSDGTYVRPHYRRTRPAAARPARRVNMTTVRPRPASASQTTRVRSYHRADGTYVRGHNRRISGPVAVAAAGGGSVILFILLLLALMGGGGAGASTPSQHPTSPASVSGHLSHP